MCGVKLVCASIGGSREQCAQVKLNTNRVVKNSGIACFDLTLNCGSAQ